MLNLKNTLDGYLKNVEVIGNTVQDENNLADIRSVGDKVEGQELYNIAIQVANGNGINEVVKILSPVQLEKVGDVADRIICKDGVWGVEKNIKTVVLDGSGNWSINGASSSSMRFSMVRGNNVNYDLVPNTDVILSDMYVKRNIDWGSDVEGIENGANDLSIRLSRTRISTHDVAGFKEWIKTNNVLVKYQTQTSQFIPLPHDQQVKLRTFAGQTNITFLTEIVGQIKAQVPKSLGATVNTHTEQISNLNKELDRVNKLEETTVSTVDTESNFTTVDATSNGYFEDVKLEGNTLVNYLRGGVGKVELVQDVSRNANKDYYLTKYELNTDYYIIFPNFTPSSDNTLSSIYGGFVNGDWLNRINFKEDSSGVYKIRIDDREPLFFRIYVERGTSDYRLSFDGAMLIPCSEITYEQALELTCFEGLMSVGQDVEEISVESVSGNLYAFSNIHYASVGSVKLGEHYTRTYTIVNTPSNRVLGGLFKLPKDNQRKLYIKCNGYKFVHAFTDKDGILLRDAGWAHIDVPLSPLIGEDYLVLYICRVDGNIMSQEDIDFLKQNTVIRYADNFSDIKHTPHKSNKKPLLYYNPTTETWEKPILREWDSIEKHADGKYYYHKRSGEVCINNIIASNISDEGIVGAYRRFKYMFNANILPNSININNRYNVINNDSQLNGGSNFYVRVAPNIVWVYAKDTALTKENMVEHFNGLTVVYQLAQEEVYECSNIDLMTYSGETNYIINSGAISPKSLLKVHNNISNVVKILQEKVSLLENTFIAGLRSVLAGDMYSLATILYPEDFEQADNIENDIMVIPE